MNKKILFISYFARIPGCCPAEWYDDKVDSLLKLNKELVLITGPCATKFRHPNVTHYRVPSLSPRDISHEYNEIRDGNLVLKLVILLLLPIILTLGLTLDLVQLVLTKGFGGSKLSWSISSTAVAVPIVILSRFQVCFTTGGPVAAHFTGVLLKIWTGFPLICELQDPLAGKGIGRSKNSASILGRLEKLVVNKANKVVFVTQTAALEAREVYQTDNIVSIYPGAKWFPSSAKNEGEAESEEIRIVHLGTLYSSRNFYTLIQAINILKKEGTLTKTIRLINRGEMYGDFKDHHLSQGFVQKLPIIPREEALAFAQKSTINVIIQHTDDRSTITIPYKTYDYLNLGVPILGLTNNPELSQLLTSNGHFSAKVSEPEDIAKKIREVLNSSSDRVSDAKIDPVEQTAELLKLP